MGLYEPKKIIWIHGKLHIYMVLCKLYVNMKHWGFRKKMDSGMCLLKCCV